MAMLEEVLMRLHQRGEGMAEVPITFTERERGQSKLSLREAVRSMLQIISLAGGKFTESGTVWH